MNDTITLFDAHSSTLTHILFDEGSREAAIVDPVDTQIERDLAVLADRQLQLKWVLETHAHADHVTAAGKLAARTGASTAVPAYCGIQQATRQLEDGDTLSLGNRAIRAIHTPGHTAGSMCFRWGNAVLTGDTLLIGGCGRTDFQSGNAGALYDSITQKLFTLPDTTRVLPGHDYHGNTESTIGAEKQSNPRLAGKTREEFINLMNDLHLAPPKMIEVAVPANLHLGALPDDVIQPMPDYAGNVSLSTAHRWWREGRVVMVDVRTQAERDWVGYVPDVISIPWKHYPGMALNVDFAEALKARVPLNRPVMFLCRSGARSAEAARLATSLGYAEAYNILEGFEGDADVNRQRGHLNGWRHAGYPWVQ